MFHLLNDHHTICALATASGGAIGVIRISGPEAIALVDKAQYLVDGLTKSGVVSLSDHLDAPFAKGTAVKINQNQFCDVKAGATKVIGTAEVAVPANAYFWAFVSA